MVIMAVVKEAMKVFPVQNHRPFKDQFEKCNGKIQSKTQDWVK